MYFVWSFDYYNSFDVAHSYVACGQYNHILLYCIHWIHCIYANGEQTNMELACSRCNWKLQSSSFINSPQSTKLYIFRCSSWFNHICYSNLLHVLMVQLYSVQINCTVNFIAAKKIWHVVYAPNDGDQQKFENRMPCAKICIDHGIY